MQALRLARSSALKSAAQRRCLTTATANHVDAAASSSTATSSRVAPIPLSNIEAQWARMTNDEKASVHEQLELVQQKDWKTLSLDEKKAAYYVAFGPHGPRTPTSQPGDNLKIFLSTLALVGISGLVFLAIQSRGQTPPRTINKEWQEASNERAKEMKLNPITGISSEGYSGKGFVQAK
ncbi:cytochrome c oxidase subunit IV-domain-containing protein [Pholiota molesta]|nr:cytochrome c oxidase subunit IV-domain-containing protein [Pholiota molesta]KAF8177252.1 cytochrome c oxidase subunit IV-domain-containing protein [Pholiota molesta]